MGIVFLEMDYPLMLSHTMERRLRRSKRKIKKNKLLVEIGGLRPRNGILGIRRPLLLLPYLLVTSVTGTPFF